MLVLSRKPKQVIHIGEEITITVVHVNGSIVRLGIEAPDDVRILRSELAEWFSKEETEPAATDVSAQPTLMPRKPR